MGKTLFAVLRRQVTLSSSQDVLFSLQEVPEEIERSVRTLHGQKIYRKVRERVLSSESSAVW